jgi:hypothetical protein
MKIPNLGQVLDERFFDRRRRSSSIAGIVGGVLAGGLFLYRLYVDDVIVWELFAVVVAIAVVKIGLMLWYAFTD